MTTENLGGDLAERALAILGELRPEALEVDQRLRYASALATLALHSQVVELTRYMGWSRAEERRDAAMRAAVEPEPEQRAGPDL